MDSEGTIHAGFRNDSIG